MPLNYNRIFLVFHLVSRLSMDTLLPELTECGSAPTLERLTCYRERCVRNDFAYRSLQLSSIEDVRNPVDICRPGAQVLC
jgi:hypothetical protein